MIEGISYYTHNARKVQVNIERHQIKFHELTFLIDGKMTYYVDDVEYEMTSGDIIYLPTGSIRQRDIMEGDNDYISINFHATEILPLNIHSKNVINEEISLLLRYFDAVNISPITTTPQKLIYLLETIVLQIADNTLSDNETPLAHEIANYLVRHYRERVSLEDVSRETYFSVAYCEGEFKKVFGKSIIHYLIDLRIAESKKLIADTSLPCSVIADMVGFDDANYFSRIFKKRVGYSPLQYRTFFTTHNNSKA